MKYSAILNRSSNFILSRQGEQAYKKFSSLVSSKYLHTFGNCFFSCSFTDREASQEIKSVKIALERKREKGALAGKLPLLPEYIY